jgi:fumarate hydratase class II
MTATRVEWDGLGPVNVSADKLWGAHTQQSLDHFSIGDDRLAREMIPAYEVVQEPASPADDLRRKRSVDHAVPASTGRAAGAKPTAARVFIPAEA